MSTRVCGQTREFGPEHAAEIATDVEKYTRYNARRKPELIDATTFSLANYHEADRVEQEWSSLAASVDKLATELPEEERASFFELVQYPVDACANLTEMYIAAGRNALYARQGRASANSYAALSPGAVRQRRRAHRRIQPQAAERPMEPHDGPDAHRLYVLERASAERHARGH